MKYAFPCLLFAKKLNGLFTKVNPRTFANVATSFASYNSSISKLVTISNKNYVYWVILLSKNDHDDTLIDC